MRTDDASLSERLEAMAESDLIPMEDACNLLREAAELARRVERALVVEMTECCGHLNVTGTIEDDDHLAWDLKGKRVRLVLEEG